MSEPRDDADASEQIDAIREEIERRAHELGSGRWNASPEEVRRAVGKLVLTLIEFLRQLMERQAIRRMESQTLTPGEVERIGLALMQLEETVRDLARQFGIPPDELNLDLGPLGKLM